MTSKLDKSSLSVQKGIEKPSPVNIHLKVKRRKLLSVKDYIDGIHRSDFSILSQAISLVESQKLSHNQVSEDIIRGVLKYSGHSIRIGITGVPGVGKSTFTPLDFSSYQ